MAVGSVRLPATNSTDWIRPFDWLPMPANGAQEFVGLLAIHDDDSQYIALLASGNYTVDWGDGVIENVVSGLKAEHQYNYASISSSTISTRGYKQVIVRVTPQGGANLTTINLRQTHSAMPRNHVVGWLDINISGTLYSTISLGGTPATSVQLAMCERVIIESFGSITSLGGLFRSFTALQSISVPSNTLSVTNFSLMFNGCSALKKLPFFDMASNTNLSSFCNGCISLIEVPLYNTALVTDFSAMFSGCSNLMSIPLFNTSSGLNFTSMLVNALSLQNVPLLNMSLGTNVTTMFSNCASLQSIPTFNFASVTTTTNVFSGCPSLSRGRVNGIRFGISYATMCLSTSAIIDIFNGLGTASGVQIITISSNFGFAGLTPANLLIATAKGWTIA
jgi:hypothetical protein